MDKQITHDPVEYNMLTFHKAQKLIYGINIFHLDVKEYIKHQVYLDNFKTLSEIKIGRVYLITRYSLKLKILKLLEKTKYNNFEFPKHPHIFSDTDTDTEVWRELVKVVINNIEEERKEQEEFHKKIMSLGIGKVSELK